MSSPTSGRSGPPRPSPAVYRRRRVVALLIVLLLVAAVAWGVSALLGGGAGAGPVDAAAEPAPTTSSDAGVEEPSPGEVGTCTAADLEADVELDPATPAAGSGVRFVVTVRNVGEQPCLVDAGRANLTAEVSSGSDPVWDAAHCAAEDATNELLLDTGTETSVAVSWNGRRSAAGCPDEQPHVDAGTYRVAVELAGEPVERQVFRLE